MIRNHFILNKIRYLCSDPIMRYIWLFFRYAIAIIISILIYVNSDQYIAAGFIFLVLRLEEMEVYTSVIKTEKPPSTIVEPLKFNVKSKEE